MLHYFHTFPIDGMCVCVCARVCVDCALQSTAHLHVSRIFSDLLSCCHFELISGACIRCP